MRRFRVAEKPAHETRLGLGTEKEVFPHPRSQDLVVGFAQRESSEVFTTRQVKGLYCLTKIAHLLFPEKIPDIRAVDTRHNGVWTVVRKRVAHDPRHKVLNKYAEIVLLHGKKSVDPDLSKKADSAGEAIEKDPAVDVLMSELSRAGLPYDAAAVNYTKRNATTAVYFDTFVPWYVFGEDQKFITGKQYQDEKLRQAIAALPSPRLRRQALSYLAHLDKLYAEDVAAVAKGKADWVGH